ncbi:hypothetical protein D3C80_1884520 [compost metagenome]
MAKASRLFSGFNVYGIAVQVAEREDGQWFSRSYDPSYNHYGRRNGRSKYHPIDAVPVHPTRMRSATEAAGALEFIELPEKNQKKIIEWGFSYLYLTEGKNRLRLPD